MRTRFILTAVAGTLLALALAPAPAFAKGGQKGDIEAGFFFGRGNPDSYEPLNPKDASLWGVRGGYFLTDRWSVEGSWQTLGTTGDVNGPDPDVDLNSLRAGILYNFRPGKKFRWHLMAGIGHESVDGGDSGINESGFGYNFGGGGRWFFGKTRFWGLRADAVWVTASPGGDIDGSQSNYEYNGGLTFAWGGGPPPDDDADGVPNKKDACAMTPRGARIDATGCPQDADGDKVYDGLDKCDNTPKGWLVDSTGCPRDTDADGVADEMDKCPGTPKGAKVDDKGCPTEDADKDGIIDSMDRCPNTPAGTKVDPVGCPIDTDSDGVPDYQDKCPDTPKGSKVDETGCPAAA